MLWRNFLTKKNRLSGDLYGVPGAYFITLCTQDRKNLFWLDNGTDVSQGQALTVLGKMVEEELHALALGYGPFMRMEKFVVMPNHVHFLLVMEAPEDHSCPDIRYVVRLFKRKISQRAGHSLWQKGFYDRIVRNEHEFQKIWKYIEENPVKWKLDRYYTNDSKDRSSFVQ